MRRVLRTASCPASLAGGSCCILRVLCRKPWVEDLRYVAVAFRWQLLVLLLSGISHGVSLSAEPVSQAVPTQPLEQHKSLGAVRLTLTESRPVWH